MQDRILAAGLQPTTSAQFVGLLAARRVCTDTSGDERMRKTSTWLLEQGTQTPSPAPDLIAAETRTENSHWDWYSERGHFTCGTSGRRELCGSRVPDERATRLQADGIGTIDASLSATESGARPRTAHPLEGAGGPAHALRLSAAHGHVGAGRNTGQPQASVPAVSRGRIGDEDSTAPAD